MKNKYFLLLISFLIIPLHNLISQTNLSELKYLSQNSDAIVTGKVVNQKSYWNKDKSRILTRAEIQISESLKGADGVNQISVNYLGGEVDGVGELYTHSVTLENNEEVLLFIKKDKDDTAYKIFEGESGKISLKTDIKTGEKLTSRNIPVSVYKKEISKIITQE